MHRHKILFLVKKHGVLRVMFLKTVLTQASTQVLTSRLQIESCLEVAMVEFDWNIDVGDVWLLSAMIQQG